MDRTKVNSSNIASIGYDPDGGRLHVEFHSGAVHEYDGVTPDAHRALMRADSIGGHFHKHVKPFHPSRKV